MKTLLLLLALAVCLVSYFLFHPRFFTRPLSRSRRFWLAILQLVPLLLLCWLLGNPFVVRAARERVDPVVAVVLDDSPSMGFEDGSAGRPRIEMVEEWAEEWSTAQK